MTGDGKMALSFSECGKVFRMKRVFSEDGKALVVAMDHNMIFGNREPFSDIKLMLNSVMEGSPDAVLMGSASFRATSEIAKPDTGIIMRVSGAVTIFGNEWREALIMNADSAMQCGADAVACTIKFGVSWEREAITDVHRLAVECDRMGMPLMIEVMVGEKGECDDPAKLSDAVGIACEIGADFIKVKAPNRCHADIVRSSRVPLLMLGGSSQVKSSESLAEEISRAVANGFAGAVAGRRIWESKDIPSAVRAAMKAVHG